VKGTASLQKSGRRARTGSRSPAPLQACNSSRGSGNERFVIADLGQLATVIKQSQGAVLDGADLGEEFGHGQGKRV
jgi:hypothetical protein